MSMIKHCDRCGKAIFNNFDGISLKSDTEIKLGFLTSTKVIDLCGPCFNRFKLWLDIDLDTDAATEEKDNPATKFIVTCDEETGDINASEYFKSKGASNRLVNCLARCSWHYGESTIKWLIDDILNNEAYETLKVRTVGRKTIDEIINLLIEYGLIKEIECDSGTIEQ